MDKPTEDDGPQPTYPVKEQRNITKVPLPKALLLTQVIAKGMASKDRNGKSDPFFRIGFVKGRMDPCLKKAKNDAVDPKETGVVLFQSAVTPKALDVWLQWEPPVRLDLDGHWDHHLRIEIWDKDWHSASDWMGCVNFEIMKVELSTELEYTREWSQVAHHLAKPSQIGEAKPKAIVPGPEKGDVKGNLCLGLIWEASEELQPLIAQEAKFLKKKEKWDAKKYDRDRKEAASKLTLFKSELNDTFTKCTREELDPLFSKVFSDTWLAEVVKTDYPVWPGTEHSLVALSTTMSGILHSVLSRSLEEKKATEKIPIRFLQVIEVLSKKKTNQMTGDYFEALFTWVKFFEEEKSEHTNELANLFKDQIANYRLSENRFIVSVQMNQWYLKTGMKLTDSQRDTLKNIHSMWQLPQLKTLLLNRLPVWGSEENDAMDKIGCLGCAEASQKMGNSTHWEGIAWFFIEMAERRNEECYDKTTRKWKASHPCDQVMKSTPVFTLVDGIGVNNRSLHIFPKDLMPLKELYSDNGAWCGAGNHFTRGGWDNVKDNS